MICCHGDELGIVLEGLAPEADLGEPPPDRLTPELVRQHANLRGRVVVPTSCVSGSLEMAGAFLDAGCAAYIAPDGYPYSALLFLHHLYHELPVGAALPAAADAARSKMTTAGSSGCGRRRLTSLGWAMRSSTPMTDAQSSPISVKKHLVHADGGQRREPSPRRTPPSRAPTPRDVAVKARDTEHVLVGVR